jgi:hypothetical protein
VVVDAIERIRVRCLCCCCAPLECECECGCLCCCALLRHASRASASSGRFPLLQLLHVARVVLQGFGLFVCSLSFSLSLSLSRARALLSRSLSLLVFWFLIQFFISNKKTKKRHDSTKTVRANSNHRHNHHYNHTTSAHTYTTPRVPSSGRPSRWQGDDDGRLARRPRFTRRRAGGEHGQLRAYAMPATAWSTPYTQQQRKCISRPSLKVCGRISRTISASDDGHTVTTPPRVGSVGNGRRCLQGTSGVRVRVRVRLR